MLIKLDENMSVAHAEFFRQMGYDCDRVDSRKTSGKRDRESSLLNVMLLEFKRG